MINNPNSPAPSRDDAHRSWRNVLPIHEAANIFPPMSPDELKATSDDIKRNGIRIPVVLWAESEGSQPYLLEGRNRLDAAELAGLDVFEIREGVLHVLQPSRFVYADKTCCSLSSVKDPYEFVLSANLHRRHLDAKQKRDVIAKLIKAQPEKSDRQIAKMVGVDGKTVSSVRREMEANAEIPHKADRTEATGRKARGRKPGSEAQPATKKRRDVDDFLEEKLARLTTTPEVAPEIISDEKSAASDFTEASPPRTLLLLNCKDAARSARQGLEYSGPVDDEILKAAGKAAEAWAKLYDKLLDNHVRSRLDPADQVAEVEQADQTEAVDQAEAGPVLHDIGIAERAARAGADYGDLPEFLRRTA